jgi:hypothetical protein
MSSSVTPILAVGWLQIFDLQCVGTAAGISRCDDNQCRDQSKAEEKGFPEQ